MIAPKTTPTWRLPILLTSLVACLLSLSLPAYARTSSQRATSTQKQQKKAAPIQKSAGPAKTALTRPDGLAERLNRIERCVVGTPHRELDFNRRLGALEIEIFGTPKLGGVMHRLQALEKAVGTSTSASTYLPPVAPQLDAGVREPKTPPAREVATRSDRFEASAPANVTEAKGVAQRIEASSPTENVGDNVTASKAKDTESAAQAQAEFDNIVGSNAAPSDGDAKIASASPSPSSNRISQTSRTPARASEEATSAKTKNNEREITELLRKGMTAHNDGHDDDAEKLFKEVLVLSPFNPDAYFNLGAISEKKGDLVTALGNYRTALIAHPDDRQLQSAVAQIEDQIAHKQGGVFQNPVVFKDSDKTILRGNASDFELQKRAGASQMPAFAPQLQNAPFTGQANQRAMRPPVVPVAQYQPPNKRSKYTAAAGELAINVARAGLTGILSGRGVNAGTFMGSLHCPVCRLLH